MSKQQDVIGGAGPVGSASMQVPGAETTTYDDVEL